MRILVKKQKKQLTKFKAQLRSRHPSHEWLREQLSYHLLPFRSVIRLGSTTSTDQIFRKRTPEQRSRVIECNTVEAVKTSSSKLLMKKAFTTNNVKTADWFHHTTSGNISEWCFDKYPIVAKHIHGSRNEGNTLIKTQEELQAWMSGKTISNYIFEKFYNFSREYRLHVTKDGCFYTNRKMLKEETPENQKWYRNDSNCVWMLKENPLFDKPSNWDAIVGECIKALNAVGLDIGGFDVKVQSAKTSKGKVRENPEFIIIESNSACSHGDITRKKYLDAVVKILKNKHELKYNRGN